MEAYPGKILLYLEMSLSDSDGNRFHDAKEKSARGVEVLVDLLLLSHRNYILKCHSAAGEMALVLNPALEFFDLNYAAQAFQVNDRPFRSACAWSIRHSCAIWRRLGKNDMALARVTSIEDDLIMVDAAHPRPLNGKERAGDQAPKSPLFSGRFLSDGLFWLLQTLADLCFEYRK